MPSLDVIRAAQRKAVADLGTDVRSFMTTLGQVTLATDDIFRVRVETRDVLWIPPDDKALQTNSIDGVCAHTCVRLVTVGWRLRCFA